MNAYLTQASHECKGSRSHENKTKGTHLAVKPLTLSQLMLFSRTLATTAKAGIPILRALTLVEHQLPTSRRGIIVTLRTAIQNGHSLAHALRGFPDSFDPLTVGIIEIGERSGTLAESLSRLAATLEARQNLRSASMNALLYPVLVGSCTLVVTALLLLFVVPTFRELFAEHGIPLPLLTQLILSLSDGVISSWHLVLGGGGVAALAIKRSLNSSAGRERITTLAHRLPLVGPLLSTTTVVRLTKALATTIAVGIPAAESLTLCASHCATPSQRERLASAAHHVREGNPLAATLASLHIFPSMVVEMLAIGEETGTLDAALENASRWHDDELNRSMRRLAQLIEPILMLLLGVVVGGIVLAMYLPIFEMGNVMTP